MSAARSVNRLAPAPSRRPVVPTPVISAEPEICRCPNCHGRPLVLIQPLEHDPLVMLGGCCGCDACRGCGALFMVADRSIEEGGDARWEVLGRAGLMAAG